MRFGDIAFFIIMAMVAFVVGTATSYAYARKNMHKGACYSHYAVPMPSYPYTPEVHFTCITIEEQIFHVPAKRGMER